MFTVIDVTDWQLDVNHGIFPIGARDKEMIWSPKEGVGSPFKANWPYLFKQSIVKYPDQYWTEVVAFIVGKHLGVEVPSVMPAVKNKNASQVICGALIEWFYDQKQDKEKLHPAGDFFKKLIHDFDDKEGKQHNLIDLKVILQRFVDDGRLITDSLKWLLDMMLFDVLIGNTDRHQENWGFVFQSDGKVRLTPLFDNGTALGHERFTERVVGWYDNELTKYIKKGKHHLRDSRGQPRKRIKHFPMSDFLNLLALPTLDHLHEKTRSLN